MATLVYNCLSSNATATYGVAVPFNGGIIREAYVVSGDPGDAGGVAVTLKKGSTTVGSMTIANGTSVAAAAAYTPSATVADANTKFSQGDVLTIVIAEPTNAIAPVVTVIFDEFSRPAA